MDQWWGRRTRTGWWTRLAGLAFAALAAACGDATVAPDPPDVTVVDGAGQEGLEGRFLPRPVVLEARDGRGVAVAGAPVTVAVRSGGGSVEAPSRTDAFGRVAVTWRLGPADGAEQTVSVTVAGAERTVSARALPESAGDLLVVRGAAGPLKGVVVLRPPTAAGLGDILEEVVTTDTLVRLQPRRASGEVVVFAWDNPPETAVLDWTPAVDTAELVLRPPVTVDFTVYVTVPVPLEVKRAELENDLAALRFVDEAEGLGIAVGNVRVVDLTARADTTSSVSGPAMCQNPGPVDDVNVHYVWRIVQYWGYACPPGLVYMSHQRRDTAPYLFPHEMGHVFGLNHTEGLMNPNAQSSGLTEGQIFRAHYQPWSSLNVTFDALPAEARRNCWVGLCLPEDYRLRAPRPRR